MTILLKQVKVIDELSDYHEQVVDIFIENDIVSNIAPNIATKADEVIEMADLHISPGFFDIGTLIGEPGEEFKEDINSIEKVALAGGYTGLALYPNNQPVIDNKSLVENLIQRNSQLKIAIYPIGALSVKTKGEQLAELMDMHKAGAVAFSDGIKPIAHAGLLRRGLEYIKPINGLIIQNAMDENLAEKAMLWESETCIQMGLPGIPAIAESEAVHRDIQICKYLNAKIHFNNITQPDSLKYIAQYKTETNITCGTTSLHLLLEADTLLDFDAAYKLMPPLVNNSQRNILIDNILNNNIDIICSGHRPQNIELKDIEFDQASYGAINLQTSFAVCNTAFTNKVNLAHWIKKISTTPRKILGLSIPVIGLKENANFTLYLPNKAFSFSPSQNVSKSQNSPLFNYPLVGQIVGSIFKNNLNLNKL
jgi:dihydroorotase